MNENRKICIEVNIEEINAFKSIIESNLESITYNPNIMKATALLTNLLDNYEKADTIGNLKKPNRILSKVKEIEYLNSIIERQKWKISGLMAIPILQGVQDLFVGANNGAIAMESTFNPGDVEIHSTNEHVGEDFMVSPRNIFAIKSEGKRKVIYLKSPIAPMQGGTRRYRIQLDSNFDELLKEINQSSQILLRVSNGFAINVFEYVFSKPGIFVVHTNPRDKLYKSIIEIAVDSKFNPKAYHQTMRQLNEYDNYRNNFQSNLQKIKQIASQIEYFQTVYGLNG
ncbi:MAG: hypothetical protein H6550_14815 [Chitinophagales bacterium]|nr:hypothetical protein [Chitinophagales bacterium]